jgi:hypothetical protein
MRRTVTAVIRCNATLVTNRVEGSVDQKQPHVMITPLQMHLMPNAGVHRHSMPA